MVLVAALEAACATPRIEHADPRADCGSIRGEIVRARTAIIDLDPGPGAANAEDPLLPGHQQLLLERRENAAEQRRLAGRIGALEAQTDALGCKVTGRNG